MTGFTIKYTPVKLNISTTGVLSVTGGFNGLDTFTCCNINNALAVVKQRKAELLRAIYISLVKSNK